MADANPNALVAAILAAGLGLAGALVAGPTATAVSGGDARPETDAATDSSGSGAFKIVWYVNGQLRALYDDRATDHGHP